VYDETLRVLRSAVDRARLGNDDKLAAIRRLDDQARLAEAAAAGRPLPSLPALFAEERAEAPGRGGRTVFDDGRREAPRARPQQLTLRV
jgi:hypothetical protein